jgi:creatinine amidohydrolase/Fe(II)-dependent formamide hydrolase-like protein
VRLDHLLSKEPLALRRAVIARLMHAGRLQVNHWLAVDVRGIPSDAVGTRCSALRVRALEHLENSIASASIYKQSSYEGLTVDALAPGADEGRVWLRKASGSCRESFDPEMSEWGNPAGVMPGHPSLNT